MPTTETPDKKYFNLAEANRLVGCVDGVVIDHKHGYVGRIVKDLMDTYSALIMVRRNMNTSKKILSELNWIISLALVGFIMALGPVLIKVYSVGKMPGNQSPIDVRTVNQAIDYLNP